MLVVLLVVPHDIYALPIRAFIVDEVGDGAATYDDQSAHGQVRGDRIYT